MKILHLTPFYPPIVTGGAEVMVEVLAQSQRQLGHEVAVATLSKRPQRSTNRDGVQVHYIANWRRLWIGDPPSQYSKLSRGLAKVRLAVSFKALARLEPVIEAFKPDILNVHSMTGLSPMMWRAASRRKIPVVYTIHDYTFYCARSNIFRDGEICDERPCASCFAVTGLNRLSQHHADAIVGVGRDILERHLKVGLFRHVPLEMRRVIGNPINKRTTQSIPRDPNTPFTFGYLGRLVPEKGVEVLLEACRHLPKDESWRLVIGGRDTGAVNLRDRVSKFPSGLVEHLGWVDPDKFLDSIDVLVAPSIWAEPFGRVIVDAFAHGVPAISTNIAGPADLITPGLNGWLVSPGNALELAEAMTAAIEAGREAMPKAEAFTSALEATDPSYIAAEYDRLYEDLINKVSRDSDGGIASKNQGL